VPGNESDRILKEIGVAEIVVRIQKQAPVARGIAGQRAPLVADPSQIRLVPEIAYPAVLVPPYCGLGIVARAIVGDDDFEMGIALRQATLNGVADELCLIESPDHNGEKGLPPVLGMAYATAQVRPPSRSISSTSSTESPVVWASELTDMPRFRPSSTV